MDDVGNTLTEGQTVQTDAVTAVETPALQEVETVVAPESNSEEGATNNPSETDPSSPPPEDVKKFSQKELEEALTKRLAKAERQFKKELSRLQAEVPQAPVTLSAEALRPEDFASHSEYVSAVIKSAELEAVQRQNEVMYQQKVKTFQEREEEYAETHPDYFDVTRVNGKFPVTEITVQSIVSLDNGPQVLDYLAKPENLQEAVRISKLPPVEQIVETTKLGVKLSNGQLPSSAPKKVSSAPTPINPISPRATSRVTDVNDPRSLDDLDRDQWIRNAKELMMKQAGKI